MRFLALCALTVFGAGCSGGGSDEGDVKKEGKVEVVMPKPGDVAPEDRARK